MAVIAHPKYAYNHKRQQDAIRDGKCINGPEHHEEPTINPRTGKRNVRCRWCKLVHAVGVIKAQEIATAHKDNPQPPPNWRLKRAGPNGRA